MESIISVHKKPSKQEIAKHINYLKCLKQSKTINNLLEYWKKRFKNALFEDQIYFSKRSKKEQRVIKSIMKDLEPITQA